MGDGGAMTDITVTAWEVDPAFSVVRDTGMAQPDKWTFDTLGETHFYEGKPVSLEPYLREVVLSDSNNDGFISNEPGDLLTIGGQSYRIYEIFRGDTVTVDGVEYSVVTLYGTDVLEKDGGIAISFPLDEQGAILPAWSGMISRAGWNLDSAPYPIPVEDLPCFVAGSAIMTPAGPVPVERLCPGDLVLTADRGAQPVIWVARSELPCDWSGLPARSQPLRVPAGVLGAQADLWLSPCHRVLMSDRRGQQVLVALRHLSGRQGIAPVPPPAGRPRAYVHLALPQHGILFAEGLACESFYPGVRALAILRPRQRSELLAALPMILKNRRPVPARPLIDRRREAQLHLPPEPEFAEVSGSATLRPSDFRSALLT